MRQRQEDTGRYSISERVIDRIADHRGVDPLDLETPLHEVVDPDALDTLFAPTSRGSPRPTGRVTFPYEDCQVAVESDGTVHVTAAPRD